MFHLRSTKNNKERRLHGSVDANASEHTRQFLGNAGNVEGIVAVSSMNVLKVTQLSGRLELEQGRFARVLRPCATPKKT